jgi:uncharacterized membrane protein
MKYVLCFILLIYYFFCSGISYELFTPNVISHVETPYNIGLSAERTGISNITTQDDLDAVQWLKDNAGDKKVVGDYSAYLIQHGFMQNHYNGFDRYGSLNKIEVGDLVFLTSWNVRNKAFIEPNGVGTREKYPLPNLSGLTVLFGGKAKILIKDSVPTKPMSKLFSNITATEWIERINEVSDGRKD